MDDVGQIVDVQAPSCHVRGNQHLQVPPAKLIHDIVSLALGQIPVQSFGVVAVLDQPVRDLLGIVAGSAENDAVDSWMNVDQTFERQIAISRLHHVELVADVVGGRIGLADNNRLRVRHVVRGYGLDLPRHGCREEQSLPRFGHMFDDCIDGVTKTHVEHLIRFIENQGVQPTELDRPTLQHVE